LWQQKFKFLDSRLSRCGAFSCPRDPPVYFKVLPAARRCHGQSGRVAIAELVSRGKEQLVLIRPYRKGLVLHTMYYGNEVRDFNQVPKGNDVKISEEELELGIGLIDRLTTADCVRITANSSQHSTAVIADRGW
jgi:non-homologous end joining protein Ku